MTSLLMPARRRPLTATQKTSLGRSILRAMSGERNGTQIIAACRTKTEFCARTGVHHLAFDGEVHDTATRALALNNPSAVFTRRARSAEPFRALEAVQ